MTKDYSNLASAGILYVVGTPLGNLADLSERASKTLYEVDRIYAEDTRRARILLNHIGATTSVKSLHEHNERSRRREVLDALEAGLNVALISDAGTPAVSDPGADLVAGVSEAGYVVSPVPGPCAMVAALSVGGFSQASNNVLFLGFLPTKGKGREDVLGQIDNHNGVVVFYESPRRLAKTLGDIARFQPERQVVISRELTKIHEELVRGPLSELVDWAGESIRGEITVVVGPSAHCNAQPAPDAALDEAIEACLKAGLSARDTAQAVAAILGLSKRHVYGRVNTLSEI